MEKSILIFFFSIQGQHPASTLAHKIFSHKKILRKKKKILTHRIFTQKNIMKSRTYILKLEHINVLINYLIKFKKIKIFYYIYFKFLFLTRITIFFV